MIKKYVLLFIGGLLLEKILFFPANYVLILSGLGIFEFENIRFILQNAVLIYELLFSLLVAVLMYRDMKREGVQSWFILILTIFYLEAGLLFFWLFMEYKRLKIEQI